MATIKSSDLDFQNIKNNLKVYLQQQDEFSDYNFEASGLSNVLDVLAYNTHVNGLIANFGLNEAFLNSAQLRSSVISHAETLGYYPKSVTGARANLNISITTSLSSPTTITLPAYSTFTTSIDDVSYSFQTLNNYIGTLDPATGTYTFASSDGDTNIAVVEGTLRTKNFIVGDVNDEQVYVIPDPLMDTSTIVVKVYDSPSAVSYNIYNNVTAVARVNPDSRIYIVRETPNGYFEMIFSDGNVLGTPPVSGNKITVEYLTTSGVAGNGGTVFAADDLFNIGGTDYPLNITTVSNSAGGSDKESITSIKLNAPRAFAAQQRLVTAEDYKALILANYSSTVDDVIAWGGNDNVPPVYGRVYISLKFKDNITDATKQTVKDTIVSSLSENLAIMSIDTIFTDPEFTYLEINTFFNFDPDLSGATVKGIESDVQTAINNYVTTNLNQFSGVFRRSNALAVVDDISPAILNSRMSVKMQKRFTPLTNALQDYTVDFPVIIADPDDVNYRVTSSRFTFAGQTCTLRNKLNSNTIQIISSTGTVIKDNSGSYNASKGTVTITAFQPTAIEGSEIKLSVVPANESTIRPLRNYILNIDQSVSFAQAIIDYQNTETVL